MKKECLVIGLGIYVGIPLTFTLFYVVIILFSAFFKLLPIHKNSSTDQTTRTAIVETQKMPSSVYVKEINRTCYLDGEDYYDEMHVRLVRLKFHCDLGN